MQKVFSLTLVSFARFFVRNDALIAKRNNLEIIICSEA